MLEQYKEIWAIKTLIDITKTGNVRGNGKSRNQQRNFETLAQTVSILAQPTELYPPRKENWSDYQKHFKEAGSSFGSKHEFTQEMMTDLTVWTWRFGVEHAEVFGPGGSLLREQLQHIPVISGLDENCVVDVPVFDTQSEVYRNVLLICETLL
jgi:ribosomal protein S30